MPALNGILDLTTGAGLEAIREARAAVTECPWELIPADRDAYIEHLDMLESAARILCALI